MSDPKLAPSTSTEAPEELDSTALTLQKLDRFDGELQYESGMWIFGYGALCWLHDFNFDKTLIGHIRGFSRKFWQGNTAHRGTQEKPGRVATLIDDENVSQDLVGTVWGMALQIKEKEVFSFLHSRECAVGGYLTTITTFYPRQDSQEENWTKPFPVVLYIATPSNTQWLGDSPLPEIAKQIVECKGKSGYNVEYLLKLANFIHENIPEAVDDHLFTLEDFVRSEIKKRNLCLDTLMGEKKVEKPEDEQGEAEVPEYGAGRDRTDSVQFTSTVLSKKLRCVDI